MLADAQTAERQAVLNILNTSRWVSGPPGITKFLFSKENLNFFRGSRHVGKAHLNICFSCIDYGCKTTKTIIGLGTSRLRIKHSHHSVKIKKNEMIDPFRAVYCFDYLVSNYRKCGS